MQIKIDGLAIVRSLLADWAHDYLSWRKPEGPLASQMFGQDGREAFDGAKNGTMDNDRSAEARLEFFFAPGVVLSIVLVGREVLGCKLVLFGILIWLLRGNGSLLLRRGLALILQVKSNRLLEVDLDSSTLVRSMKGIVNLNVNFRSIKSTITMVKSPG